MSFVGRAELSDELRMLGCQIIGLARVCCGKCANRGYHGVILIRDALARDLI
jgi:hypothetical protein